MTRQLSSGWTLMLRIFIPTFWIAFFGTFLMATIISDKGEVGSLPISGLRIGLVVFIAVFVVVFWKTLFRLKRVDADSDYVYVNNYFKSVRYPHQDVEKLNISKGFLFHYATLHLKGKGSFGDKIVFLISQKRWAIFLADNPSAAVWLSEPAGE